MIRLLSKIASGREFEGDLGSARTESSTKRYMRIPSTESTNKLPAEVGLRKKSIILGIDPSLSNTGWGVIESLGSKLSYIASGTITTRNDKKIQYRLGDIHCKLQEVILKYKPNTVAMEESFINNNPSSSLKLAHARGAIMLTMAIASIDLTEYSPTLVKKTVVGVGRADKNQVGAMIKILLHGSRADSEHSADALAVAICHSRFHK